MSNRWEHELQRWSDTDIDFPVAPFIKLHSEVPPPTIRQRHAQLRATLMKRLQKRTALGIQAATVASLNTPESQAAKGSCGGKNNTESQAAKGSSGGKKNSAQSQAAKGSSGGKKNTAESQTAKGSSGGKKNTAESQAAKGSSGGKKNTAESQASKGKRNTAESQAAKGSCGGKKNSAESQANKGKKNAAESQAAKGFCGGINNNTPESQRNKGIVGRHGNTPEKQHIKAPGRRSSGLLHTVSRELVRVNPSSPSNISLKSVREYWLDGLDTLYSPLFDALCYRCGQLLWGPIVGGHKFTVPRNTGEIRTQTLFGVPPTNLVTSGIFAFRHEMFRNYLKYKTALFPVPPRSPAPSRSRFVVYDSPVLHSATRMYACHVCSKYSAKYDPINYGYTLDGDIHYNIPSKIADLTEYRKRQIALGALYSNTLKHVDLRHKQWHHAIGTVGVGRKPSQHYNPLYGFRTMKEDILRDYQKPKDSEQSTRQMNQALLLLKKIHPLYSRFLAHYETLYRYLENAATAMGTLTQRYEDKYGKRLEYHLEDEYVAWALECDAPRNIFPHFAPHSDKVGFLHRTPFLRAGGNVTTAAQSLANDTYLHFNDPKLEPCVLTDLYPGGVGGYTVGCGIGRAAYYRSRYLAFDSRWRRDRWWSFFKVSKEMNNQLIWNQQNFKAQRANRAEDITAAHLRSARSSKGPKPAPKKSTSQSPHTSSQYLQASQCTQPSQSSQSATQSTQHPPFRSQCAPTSTSPSTPPTSQGKKPRACYRDAGNSMNHNLEREGANKGTAELNPYYRYGTYVPSKLVGSRSYWASRHLDLTAMGRVLGKADLFITLTMNDNWADLQAAVQKGCGVGAVWPGEYPKNTGANKPIQDGHDMEACVAFHKRVEIFNREFLAIGKNGQFGKVRDYWFRFEYQERGRVHLHGVVWCEANSIPDDVICATMPRESDGFDPKFTAYLRDLYKECNMQLHARQKYMCNTCKRSCFVWLEAIQGVLARLEGII